MVGREGGNSPWDKSRQQSPTQRRNTQEWTTGCGNLWKCWIWSTRTFMWEASSAVTDSCVSTTSLISQYRKPSCFSCWCILRPWFCKATRTGSVESMLWLWPDHSIMHIDVTQTQGKSLKMFNQSRGQYVGRRIRPGKGIQKWQAETHVTNTIHKVGNLQPNTREC